MTMKITPAIMIGLALIAIAPNARAEIASKQYVDETGNTLIYGTTTPDAESAFYMQEYFNGNIAGGVKQIVDMVDKLAQDHEDPIQADDGIYVTDHRGKKYIATGGVITNSNVASNANIDLAKLHFPSPRESCNTTGCMLMFYNNQYVWEPVTRDNNETISTSGSVSNNIASNPVTYHEVQSLGTPDWDFDVDDIHYCPEGQHWNEDKSACR